LVDRVGSEIARHSSFEARAAFFANYFGGSSFETVLAAQTKAVANADNRNEEYDRTYYKSSHLRIA